ncbi:TetR/AcrR family transcriptional regulator [Williamsia sp.]|uniref:TetR/AcrR family transcriptional regulator n=1 Tax=Williamsia sp. TaxID=1872085 RepID=UPI001A1E93CE|nr:TetR/AcrR family transcriptional regulator [Williamsia sp.]MBJ7291897.1 TetR/AcrR family transcriptional regulator [Williamsia sp.]
MVAIRERKREQTRQAISDAATRLFENHGFDAVTLADIAAAADVSVKTVVNYFGAKEELFFDGEPGVLDTLVHAIGDRGDRSSTSALRPYVMSGPILAGPCAWPSVDRSMWASMTTFAECEARSPILTNRRAAILQSWLDPLADAADSQAWAALAIGVLTLRHRVVTDGMREGRSPTTVRRRLTLTAGLALDALDRGFSETATR